MSEDLSLFASPLLNYDLPEYSDWHDLVEAFWKQPVGKKLRERLQQAQMQGSRIYPLEVFRALKLTPLSQVKVVILGQDPYHGPDQAEGLAFSVATGHKVPPSLRTIKKELLRDLGLDTLDHTSLIPWAKQGVLLLNTTLTVEEGRPASHAQWGWRTLTDQLIEAVSENTQHTVFLLWGSHAQSKQNLIKGRDHLVLTANHPSPLAAYRAPQPFIGCGHFSATNQWLIEHHKTPIDWRF